MKLLTLTTAIAALTFSSATFGQQPLNVEVATVEEMMNADVFMDVTMTGLTINPAILRAGTEATVSANFVNEDPVDYANTYVVASLAFVNPETSGIEPLHESQSIGPFFLEREKTTPISIPFPLPKYLADTENLWLFLDVLDSAGAYISTTQKKVRLQGAKPNFTIEESFLQRGEDKYHAQEGPIIKDQENAQLVAALVNPTSTSFKIYPKLELFIRSTQSPVVLEKELETFTLNAGEQKNYIATLPTPQNANVYLAKIMLQDASGNNYAPALYGRFITEGPIVTVLDAKLNPSTRLRKGDAFELELTYVGTPFDIDQAAISSQDPARAFEGTLEISITNEKGESVNKFEQAVRFKDTGNIKAELIAGNHATALNLDVKAMNGDQVVGTYSGQFESSKPEKSTSAIISTLQSLPSWITYAGIALAVLLLLAFVFKRRK